jgi:hypothetical protein
MSVLGAAAMICSSTPRRAVLQRLNAQIAQIMLLQKVGDFRRIERFTTH